MVADLYGGMTMENNLDIWVKISSQIGELNASVKSVLDKLTNHEQRLMSLEQKKDGDWKANLLMLLAKATVIGMVAIGSLTGASSLIQRVLNVNVPVQTEVKK